MTTVQTFYVRAIDSTAGILREESGPHYSPDEADEAAELLREKWPIATDIKIVERAEIAGLATETKHAKISTVDGVPQVTEVEGPDGDYTVPSYYAKSGSSIVEAARSLGLRVLGRREHRGRADVAAEIHERELGSPAAYCVREVRS